MILDASYARRRLGRRAQCDLIRGRARQSPEVDDASQHDDTGCGFERPRKPAELGQHLITDPPVVGCRQGDLIGHTGKDLDQIAAADDADQCAIFDHRDSLDPVPFEQVDDGSDRSIRCNVNNVARHNRIRGGTVSLSILSGVLLIRDEQFEPEAPVSFRSKLASPQKVAFSEHTNDLVLHIDDWYAADAMLGQYAGDSQDGDLGSHGHDICCHDIARLHQLALRRGSVIRRPDRIKLPGLQVNRLQPRRGPTLT